MAYTIYTGAGMGGLGNITLNGATTYTTATSPLNTVLTVTNPGSGYSSGSAWTTLNDPNTKPQLKVTGDADFDGNITVQGRNLTETLDSIESRLGILRPNPALEAEFDELKALGDAYREAEKKFNEQKKVFEILKNQDK